MADTATSANRLIEEWLAAIWRESIAESCEMLAGGVPPVTVLPAEMCSAGGAGGEAAGAGFWRSQAFDLAAGAELFVGASGDQRLLLGAWILRASGLEQPGPGESEVTYSEFFQQIVSAVGTKIGGRIGREVCGTIRSDNPPPAGVRPLGLRILIEDERTVDVFAHFSAELVAAIAGGRPPAATSPRQPEVPPANASTESGGRPASRTMDLLLDVELPVSVSFGRAHLPLRDVLKLTSGSIVELDRSVSEAVEIIVNNCTIARGEVVVVEGNYGVRVTQIISRQDRLRTLN